MKSSTKQSSSSCFFRRSVGHIVMHSKPYHSLSLSLKIEPFSQSPRTNVPLPSSSSLLNGTMSKWLFKWGLRSWGFDICFLFGFYQNVTATGRTNRLNVCSSLLSDSWGYATREQPCLSRFSLTIVHNVPKFAQSQQRYLKMRADTKQRA